MGAPMPMNMAQARICPMRIDADYITLAQWVSPAFPVGGFAFSHGIEAAIQDGLITSATDLEDWLCDLLHHGTGRNDAIWIGLGAKVERHGTLIALQDEARAWQFAAPRLREAQNMGASFSALMRDVWGQEGLPDLFVPIALGFVAAQRGIAPADAAALYLQGFFANLVAAAQRLMPLGQVAAQGILARLSPQIAALAPIAETASLDDLHSTALLSDIAAAHHGLAPARMFQS